MFLGSGSALAADQIIIIQKATGDLEDASRMLLPHCQQKIYLRCDKFIYHLSSVANS